MDTALITGASRGLGLALARELARPLVAARHRRPRRRTRWRPRARSWRRLTEVVAIAGDVADAEHLRALVAGRRPADRPARQQRQRARPEPAAGARRLPARRARARLPRQRARAAGAVPARARRGCAPGAVRAQRHLRRRGRAVRGLGRLRLVEGRARAAHAHPRRRASRTCGSSPSTPATCARRCTRRRSRARTSPTARCPRRACPGLLAIVYRRARRAGATGRAR